MFQAPEVKQKIKNTCLEKYGVSNSFQSIQTQEKWRRNHKQRRYEEFILQLKEKQIELLSSKEDFINNRTFMFKCLHCGREFYSSGTNKKHVTCICRKSISTEELKLNEWLNTLGINTSQSNRYMIYPYELDIYIPKNKLAIEFNGLFWHSELHKDKNYHLFKTIECEKKGIKLLHIFENEWKDKENIIKSLILSKLEIYNKEVNADYCEIKELTTSEYKEFILQNYIHSFRDAKIKLGLFFKNSLAYVCSFSENELICDCPKLNINVIGGREKLVKYFKQKNNINNIFMLIDRRFFDLDDYNSWKLENEIQPETLQEHISFNGKLWNIWDCGKLNLKYIGF